MSAVPDDKCTIEMKASLSAKPSFQWHVRAENFLPLHFGSLPDFTTGYGMDEILGGGVFARR
jgi:hypothetical protein